MKKILGIFAVFAAVMMIAGCGRPIAGNPSEDAVTWTPVTASAGDTYTYDSSNIFSSEKKIKIAFTSATGGDVFTGESPAGTFTYTAGTGVLEYTDSTLSSVTNSKLVQAGSSYYIIRLPHTRLDSFTGLYGRWTGFSFDNEGFFKISGNSTLKYTYSNNSGFITTSQLSYRKMLYDGTNVYEQVIIVKKE